MEGFFVYICSMEFQESDFQYLKYNPYPLPQTTNLLDKFPELKRFPEYSKEIQLDKDKVLRYIIYAYDRKSPLLSEKNLVKRKMLACKVAGFELEDGKYPELVEFMIKGKNHIINRMICCYARNQKSTHYALLVSGMESFYENLAKLSAPSDEKDDMKDMVEKNKLYKQTAEMISSIESNADEVFNGDIELIYEADEIEGEDNGRIKSYPEHIATLREEGKLGEILKKSNG